MELKKSISAIVFWGALWGLEEATLGHLLHITTLNIGWFLWFPLAYFFMGMVYKQTGKLNSILFTAMIAAAIKFIDLFMTVNPVIVICPAMSILLEGVSLLLVLKLFDQKKSIYNHNFLGIVSVSLFWRILFLIGLLAIPAWIMPAYPFKDMPALLRFLLYEGLINSLFIHGMMMSAKEAGVFLKEKNTYLKPLIRKLTASGMLEDISLKPFAALGLLIVAIFVQWVL